MAIITISRGSFTMGKTVAEKVAARLGYKLISREVLLDASERYRVSEQELAKAIHDAPSFLERYRHTHQLYVAYIRSALVERVLPDNVVYHGLAGHLLLKPIPHVLKARITSDMSRRVQIIVARENVSEPEARSIIEADDRHRQKWTKMLYGEDPADSSLYDLVVRIEKLTIDDAVDFICRAAESPVFAASKENQQKVQDLAVACRIKAMLVDEFPYVWVTSEYGSVLVYTRNRDSSDRLLRRSNEMRENIDGIYNLEVHAGVDVPLDAV